MQEYMSFVLACVGCCLAASTLRLKVEFYRCCGNARLLSTKQLIHTPTHAHSFLAVVGPAAFLFICLWSVDSEHRQDLTRFVRACVIGATKDTKTMWRAHLTWECLEKHTHTHTHISGWLSACWDRQWQWWVTAARWEPARCMCCGVLVFRLFRLSDPDLVDGVWLYF